GVPARIKRSPEVPVPMTRGGGVPAQTKQPRPPVLPKQAGGNRSLQSAGKALAPVRGAGAVLRAPKSTPDLAVRLGRTFENQLKTGLKVLLAAVGLAGGWATLVPLSGAVVVSGSLVTESNLKKVQHPSGGVVALIRVHDGSHVKEGELLARLDETTARTN